MQRFFKRFANAVLGFIIAFLLSLVVGSIFAFALIGLIAFFIAFW